MLTKKLKQKKLGPVEAVITKLRERIAKLEIIKDAKIPFYEKLPKDSPFYKHYMSVLYAARMQETTAKKVIEERAIFHGAASIIPGNNVTENSTTLKT